MLQLTAAQKHFGGRTLFEQADWRIGDQERIGLVGANGSGKSTLLKILAGLEMLDGGTLIKSRNQTIGYLPQEGLSFSGRTLLDECRSVFADLLEFEAELRELEHQLSEGASSAHDSEAEAELFERYAHLQHTLEVRGAYALEARIATVLAGLSFTNDDLLRSCEEFSGGWQMRIALAKLLLAQPDVLLLDEPTNHLDLEARNWLEDYLRQYPHSCLLVSHDRYFLDAIVQRIAELAHGKLTLYSGNYTSYLKQKEQRLEQLRAAWQNQQDKRHQLEVFINRFRYTATKASQVQSRIKELERMEKIELPPEEQTIHFRFPQPRPSGRRVVELRGVSKSYGTIRVFEAIDLVLERGERVALVGPNGAGKSTLLKLLAAVERPTLGEHMLGHEVSVDYFAQDQYRTLDPERRILDDLGAISPAAMVPQLRNLLGCFLFRGDDVFKRIAVLSGGERNRYALARMLLRPANFLLLDEPTNHLDLQAKDVLLEALQQFSGTVVFVSHDRYFIDALANKIIEVGGGAAAVYLGNYEDYRYRKEHAGEPSPVLASSAEANGWLGRGAPGAAAEADRRPVPEKRKKVNPQRQMQRQRAVAALEEEIARVETEIKDLEAAMGQGETFKDAATAQQAMRRYEQQIERRTQLFAQWEQQVAAINQDYSESPL